jgi:hypothetical protein
MTRPVLVDSCSVCPFAHATTEESIDDEPWSCTAAEIRDHYRELHRRDVWGPRGRRLPPPRWCPLRKADQLVRLKTRTT